MLVVAGIHAIAERYNVELEKTKVDVLANKKEMSANNFVQNETTEYFNLKYRRQRRTDIIDKADILIARGGDIEKVIECIETHTPTTTTTTLGETPKT